MRLLQLDDLMTSYINARPEAGLFVRLTEVFAVAIEMLITRYSEEPLAPSNFVRIADKGGQSRRECSSLELLRRGVSRHRCPYVTHPAAAATESVLFKSGLKCAFCHILAQSLFFKAPYVWDDRRPRPRAK